MASGKLLYSAGSSAQSSDDLEGWNGLGNWEEGSGGRGYIYTHIADSLHCTVETNMTV